MIVFWRISCGRWRPSHQDDMIQFNDDIVLKDSFPRDTISILWVWYENIQYSILTYLQYYFNQSLSKAPSPNKCLLYWIMYLSVYTSIEHHLVVLMKVVWNVSRQDTNHLLGRKDSFVLYLVVIQMGTRRENTSIIQPVAWDDDKTKIDKHTRFYCSIMFTFITTNRICYLSVFKIDT